MNARQIARHRNYSHVLERHNRDLKIRRITRWVVTLLIIFALVILFVIVIRLEKRFEKSNPTTSYVLKTKVS